MLQYRKNFKFKNKTFTTGNVYYFKYKKYEQDPKPLIIFLHHVRGTNPNTGSFWNFIEAINLHYIPKRMREKLVEVFDKNKRVDLNKLFSFTPAKFAYRRYITAASYITYIKEIDDKIFELKKNEHKKMYLPKGVKLNEVLRYMQPNSLKKSKRKKK